MILLVEPSRDLANTIKEALERDGIQAKVAYTAQQAIKVADQGQGALEAVVIELLMPRHNGLEFIYEFRSYADWLNTPIIIYSQLSSEELGLRSALKKEMGVVAHLYKPTTSLDQLVSEIKKAIKK